MKRGNSVILGQFGRKFWGQFGHSPNCPVGQFGCDQIAPWGNLVVTKLPRGAIWFWQTYPLALDNFSQFEFIHSRHLNLYFSRLDLT